MAFAPYIPQGSSQLPGPVSSSTTIGPGKTTDRALASTAASHLLSALAATHDSELRVTLSTALAALHKYLASDEKETHAALGGKLSPKLMSRLVGAGPGKFSPHPSFAPTLGR